MVVVKENIKTVVAVCFFSLLGLCLSEIIVRLVGYQSADDMRAALSEEVLGEIQLTGEFKGFSDGTFRATPGIEIDGEKINEFGFRDWQLGGGQRLLLLGDSFTWGTGASKHKLSYASLLAVNDYTIFNTGVPGVAPNQYATIAERYVGELNPDKVLVFIYAGNDLYGASDPLIPNHPRWWVTTHGWYSAFDSANNPLSFEDMLRSYSFDVNPIYGLGRKSALLTLTKAVMYDVYHEIKSLAPKESGASEFEGSVHGTLLTQLMNIKIVSESNGAELYVFFIPDLGKGCSGEQIQLNDFKVFDGQLILLETAEEDYHPAPNCHFNDSGHLKTYQQILRAIKNQTEIAR